MILNPLNETNQMNILNEIENDNDPFENLVPDEEGNNDQLTEDDLDLIVGNLIKLNHTEKEMEPEKIDHGKMEFNVDDILAKAIYEDENINDKIPDNIQDQLDTDETRVKIASEDISLDTTFLSWEEVEDFLKDYGQSNGFAITKYRMEKNRSMQLITKRTFVCEFGGKFKSKKLESALQAGKQRNIRTKKCQCPWHINFTFPERATCITVSLFANQHNHELRPDAFEFSSKYRKFTKEMIDEIEIMTRYGNLSITLQRNLLKARFPKMN
ncbi:hypothetical protein RhiirA1_475463, partial [Rhizophagus irregularis]